MSDSEFRRVKLTIRRVDGNLCCQQWIQVPIVNGNADIPQDIMDQLAGEIGVQRGQTYAVNVEHGQRQRA